VPTSVHVPLYMAALSMFLVLEAMNSYPTHYLNTRIMSLTSERNLVGSDTTLFKWKLILLSVSLMPIYYIVQNVTSTNLQR
jgi:hypothetical protein